MRSRLASHVGLAVARLEAPRWAGAFAASCPIPGAAPADYLHRVVSVPSSGGAPTLRAIVGIRYKGLDPGKPFIEVAARTGPIPSHAVLTGLVLAAQQAVKPLGQDAPIRLQLTDLDGPGLPPGEPDLHLVAGRVASLEGLPEPPANGFEIQLRPCADPTGMSPRYLAAYSAASPALPVAARDSVSPCDIETLRALANDGLLVEVLIDGSWAGVVGATREESFGLAGWCMVEEILAPAFRGRGLAAAVQRAFIEALPATDDELVFGTIHAGNTPSLKTALKVGRRSVRLWHFFAG